MSVQVENLEHNMAKLTIEVAAEELEKALDSAYQKQKKQISVPGFRKGKVPRAMIEKMYGAGVFYEDAANILMQQTYAGAVDESGVDIVSRPTVEVTQIEKGQPFIYTAEVAVRPEVTLGKYMGVTVTKIDTSVSDEEVDAELENQRNKNARTVTVTDRPVAEGDTAVIDFEGFVDGVAFEGGKGENHPLEIGSHTFIDTFAESSTATASSGFTPSFPQAFRYISGSGFPWVISSPHTFSSKYPAIPTLSSLCCALVLAVEVASAIFTPCSFKNLSVSSTCGFMSIPYFSTCSSNRSIVLCLNAR